MTPTPPEGLKIIPREWLEAGNPLPWDAKVWLKEWWPCMYAGDVPTPWNCANTFYATAQPLPCFQKGGDEPCHPKIPTITAVNADLPETQTAQSTAVSNAPVEVRTPDQGPEHNPDGLTPEQYGAPEWRLLRVGEGLIEVGDEWWNGRKWQLTQCGTALVMVGGNTYRRRVAPAPTPGSTPRTGTVMDCMVGGQEGLNTHPVAEQARNNALNKLACEQSGEPRTECPTCAGMNDLVATQGQRIAELERENAADLEKLSEAVALGAKQAEEFDAIHADLERERDNLKAELHGILKREEATSKRLECAITQLRATIETLTRERDAAVAELADVKPDRDRWEKLAREAAEARVKAEAEAAAMRAERDEARKDRDALKQLFECNPNALWARLDAANALVVRLAGALGGAVDFFHEGGIPCQNMEAALAEVAKSLSPRTTENTKPQ